MSSIARLNLYLICTKGLLPKNDMLETLQRAIVGTQYTINNQQVMEKGKVIGKLIVTDRIVLQTSLNDSNVAKSANHLRELFTEKSRLDFENYQYQISQDLAKVRRSNIAEANLEKLIQNLEQLKNNNVVALKRQLKDNCDAIKEELIEEANNQGYDVVDLSKDEIKLQFIKRTF